ncbi:cell division protein FtsY, partial [Aeromonas molluscorum 848]
MAKGLFSWLGFGRKKEEAEAVQPQTPQSETVSTQDGASATPSQPTDVITHAAESGEVSLPPADPLTDPLAEVLSATPLVIEECASSLEPVVVNPDLLSPEEEAANVAASRRLLALPPSRRPSALPPSRTAVRVAAEQEAARVAASRS